MPDYGVEEHPEDDLTVNTALDDIDKLRMIEDPQEWIEAAIPIIELFSKMLQAYTLHNLWVNCALLDPEGGRA